ncbi:MAG: plastocyanin/azurin family copper-binding protein, partial [Planococcus donghaensis]
VTEDTTEPMAEETTAEEGTEEESTVEEPAAENTQEAMSGTASNLLSQGEATSFVFNETGEFSIFCEPHPDMQMTVLVEEGAEAMDNVEIDIADYAFGEESITVAPGTTIAWTNQDQVQHNVAFK